MRQQLQIGDRRVGDVRPCPVADELAGEPEGEITVADLAARAAISRNSFYTHFSGIADVAAHLLTEKAAGLAANLADGHAGRAVLARSAVTLAPLFGEGGAAP
ncbi:hypothetical protein [Streptomyces sp. NPDC059850]|uniref:hypothetical protein n=1 Tax=Streptomyces sp. NPDC059850 TaxID=3346970 RepID=UPI0036534F00